MTKLNSFLKIYFALLFTYKIVKNKSIDERERIELKKERTHGNTQSSSLSLSK